MAEGAAAPAVPEPVPAEVPAAPAELEEQPVAEKQLPAAKELAELAHSPAKTKPKADAEAKVAEPAPGTPASGSRQRKKVEHFRPEAPLETKRLTVQEGMGKKLRDIPNVHFQLSKISGSDELMELLHDVLYKRKGKMSTRKRDILDFSGFTFAADTEDVELEKATAKLDRLKADALNKLLDIFELPRGSGQAGYKDAKVERIVEWLRKPQANSEKDLAAQAAKKKQAKKRKAEREEKAKAKAAPKAKKAKTGETPKKAEKARKSKAAAAAASADDSDDDLPLGVAAKLPSDKALVEKVQSILSKVNVQEFNLKALMAQLAKHFGTDLAAKKPLIKTTAIQYCLDQAVGGDEEAEAAAEEAAEEAASEEGEEEAAAEDGEGKVGEEATTDAAIDDEDMEEDQAAE